MLQYLVRGSTLLAIIMGPLVSAGLATAPADRPNVLLICVDDLKPALGCYRDQLAKTPNIDRLASRGVLFERAFCNQAVCSPSRNALLTGLRSQTLGIYDLGTNFRRAVPDRITLPQHFKQQGYHTEALGKIFHVGHGNHEDPASWSVPHWKSEVIAYALPESRAQSGLTREEALFANRPAGKLPRGAAFERADVPDQAYPDGAVAEEAIRRLQAAARRDLPFFLAVGFVKPHLPFCAPAKYWDAFDRNAFELAKRTSPPAGAPTYAPQFGGELRQYRDIPKEGPIPEAMQRTLIHGYYAAASFTDAQIGRVVDELDRLNLANQTIIVLWGDHGWHLGDHGIWCKHTNYEQATRIPLLIVAPQIQPARSGVLAESVDVYPTVCELAGVPLADSQAFDGASLAPLLADPDRAKLKAAAFHCYPRSPDGRTLIGRAVRTERYRLVEWKEPGAAAETAVLELYDYETDPAETRNLANEQPGVVAELLGMLGRLPEAKPPLRPQKGAGKNAKRKATT